MTKAQAKKPDGIDEGEGGAPDAVPGAPDGIDGQARERAGLHALGLSGLRRTAQELGQPWESSLAVATRLLSGARVRILPRVETERIASEVVPLV
jgi:hypothetical protein